MIRPSWEQCGRLCSVVLVIAWGVSGLWGSRVPLGAIPPQGSQEHSPKGTTKAAEPPLFVDWPDAKPEAVLVLSGQMYGYLQPCGCSRPQLGGLERRAQFITHLRNKGWPVIGVDVGDLPPMAGVVREQQLWKYAIAMQALREMGYVAIGAGKAEFTQGLYALSLIHI